MWPFIATTDYTVSGSTEVHRGVLVYGTVWVIAMSIVSVAIFF